MARSTSTVQAIEKKALAESNKSAGMRMLFDAGRTVVEVQRIFDAPYGYVYGVAKRHGVVETAASRRVTKAPVKAARPVRAAKVAKPVPVKARATKASTASKVAAGRPTPARRAANRKARTTA